MTREQELLSSFLKNAPRSRHQINRIHESDCEILKLGKNFYQATSIDSFADEWSIKLFQDPKTLARICVQGTLSDLVVAGVTPSGFLFSAQWGEQDPATYKKAVFSSLIRELKKTGVPLLGGDEGQSHEMSLTGVALGTSRRRPKTRIGVRPGQLICTLGDFGIGPALGFQLLLKNKPTYLSERLFHPTAQLHAAPAILKWSQASIDSSDGLCSALHTLAELNDVHFEIHFQSVVSRRAALQFCRDHRIPPLALWFGEIGDYQPIFTVRPEDFGRVKNLLPEVKQIGVVLPKQSKDHRVVIQGKPVPIDYGFVSRTTRSTFTDYVLGFKSMVEWIKETY